MTRFNQGGKRNQPVIVTSRKRIKAERQLNQAYGEQKSEAARRAQRAVEDMTPEQRLAHLQALAAPAIKSSEELHAKGAALREQAWAEKRASDAAIGSFTRKNPDIKVTITPKPEDTVVAREVEHGMQAHADVGKLVSSLPDVSVSLSGTYTKEGWTEHTPEIHVTSDWQAEDDGWMTPESGWKNAIYRTSDGKREVLNCAHKHKTPDAARACALKAASRRNNSNVRVMDGWTADARYPWTDGAVTTLIDELRAEGTAS